MTGATALGASERVGGPQTALWEITPGKSFYTGQSFNEVLRWTKRPQCSMDRLHFFFSFERSEEHTSELQSLRPLLCRLLLEQKLQPQRILRQRRGPNAAVTSRPRGLVP